MIQVVGYLAALATFVVADMVWLGLMTPRFYRPTLGDILITGVNLPPALVFYLVYPVGLVIFAVNPALKSGSVGSALLNGALFGFFTYATYDLSNYATLRNGIVTLMDNRCYRSSTQSWSCRGGDIAPRLHGAGSERPVRLG
jgi:uncharacterized membrane protein